MSVTDGFELIHPSAYESAGQPHELWRRLRAESPVHRCEPEGYGPFWAITKHADICDISKRPDAFLNEPGIVMVEKRRLADRSREEGIGAMRTVIEMDPPEHRTYRRVGSPWFTPNSLRRIHDTIDTYARELVDHMAGSTGEGECDFATDIAAAHPLRVLSTILGVPREQEPDILRLTNQLFASEDPDLQRKDAESNKEAMMKLGAELYGMFEPIIADRRAHPTDDLASLLANAQIDGAPMGPMETFGYYLITFTAGHDTTKNSAVGGMLALVQHPEQLAKLGDNPDLAASAVEEIVRWVTPVNYMKRTAARDLEVRGQKIREGDELILYYASANRDADVFDRPFEFDITRKPNPHLGFGIGEHFCMGANLARLSQRALFRELATRIEWVELAGDPEWIRSSFVVGLKHLPIRYRIRPATQ